MAIAEGKKRYYITLDENVMSEAQRYISELGLPKQTISLVIEGFLAGQFIPQLEEHFEKKRSGKLNPQNII